MAVYKFKFGDVTIAEGLPAVSPELQQWVEEQAEARMRAALDSVIQELVQQLMLTPSFPPLDLSAAKALPEPIQFKDDEPGEAFA